MVWVVALGFGSGTFCWTDGWNLGLLFWLSSCICWLNPSGNSSGTQSINREIHILTTFRTILLKYLQRWWCSITIVQVEAKPVESRVEIPSIQHAAFHCFLNVLSLKFEFLQGCVQVLQAQTKTLPILYYVTEITSEIKGKVHLYQQLFVCKSTRDGPSVPIFLSEVIDELDNFLLQVSFNVNLYAKWSNPTYWETMLFWLFKMIHKNIYQYVES